MTASTVTSFSEDAPTLSPPDEAARGARGSLLLPNCGAANTFVLGPRDQRRADATALVEKTYARVYGATVTAHYPNFICLAKPDGEMSAVVGFRFAHEEPLFLEQYLDAPVENAVSAAFNQSVARERIVEIGSLAARRMRQSPRVYAALASYLKTFGVDFAVATVTSRLTRAFEALGFSSRSLARASADRLAGGRDGWGTYYDESPIVVAGAIGEWAAQGNERTGG
jgi:hypothetical protein